MGDRDDPDDVMKTSLTIDYDKQWLNCVSAIGPAVLKDDIIHERDVNTSTFHSNVYVHPPPTYSLRASATFTDRL